MNDKPMKFKIVNQSEQQHYLKLPNGRGENRLKQLAEFSKQLVNLTIKIGMKLSARGWCYQLEGLRIINKDEFDKVDGVINECRKEGFLPVDIVLEEEARAFYGVEKPEKETPLQYFASYLRTTLECYDEYIPNWWEDEEYYIQMLVEKIDLKSLFSPVCNDYHIPIATAKGWSSIIQRAEYARRFKEAEDNGLKCVLLYCGDHDPDGLRISDTIRDNLQDLRKVIWIDRTRGYNPSGLIIKRFGLDYDFIKENNLTWIENLITGSGKNLADQNHKNHNLPYVQEYLKTVGERKCEANALVVRPDQGRQLCRDAIEAYLGHDAIKRFQEKRKAIEEEINGFLEDRQIKDPLEKILADLEKDTKDSE